MVCVLSVAYRYLNLPLVTQTLGSTLLKPPLQSFFRNMCCPVPAPCHHTQLSFSCHSDHINHPHRDLLHFLSYMSSTVQQTSCPIDGKFPKHGSPFPAGRLSDWSIAPRKMRLYPCRPPPSPKPIGSSLRSHLHESCPTACSEL